LNRQILLKHPKYKKYKRSKREQVTKYIIQANTYQSHCPVTKQDDTTPKAKHAQPKQRKMKKG
jgi:hypothetical protein